MQRMVQRFISDLHYTSCSEDLDAELAVMNIGPGDRALAIAGGGGRAIGLLLRDPAEVVALDFNPHQREIVELKKAAILALTYRENMAFLGVDEKPEKRAALWPRVRQHLPEGSREYWEARLRLIRRGLIYAGRMDEHIVFRARILRFFFKERVDALFRATSLEEQKTLWDSWARGPLWRFFLWIGASPWVHRIFVGNYAWYGHVPTNVDVAKHLLQCLDAFMGRHLARDSHLLQLLLAGRYLPGMRRPHYLDEQFYELIRSRIGRLRVEYGELSAFLESSNVGHFNRFSLSNVPAYLSDEQFDQLWYVLTRRGATGSRVIYRHFLFERKIPEIIAGRIQRKETLEEQARDIDKSIAYDFFVGDLV